MKHARSLKQIIDLLNKVACAMDGTFHSALCLWLQVQEGTRQHKRMMCADEAVQAALLAAPKYGTKQQRLAWMKAHVPGVSEAVTACVMAQSEMSLQRMKILQQLLAQQGEAFKEQLLARLGAEDASRWQLCTAGQIALFLTPLRVVITALSKDAVWACQVEASERSANQRLQAYAQADDLLTVMAAELDMGTLCILKHILGPCQASADMYNLLNAASSGAQQHDAVAQSLVARGQALCVTGSIAWLAIALTLPPSSKHDTAPAWLRAADWDTLLAASNAVSSMHLQPVMRWLLLQVLARSDLLQHMVGEQHTQALTGRLLQSYGVQRPHLRDAHVPEDKVQQLIALKQQACEKVKVASTACDSQGDSAVDGRSSTVAAAAGDDDRRLDDMQALLELMYGTLDIKL